MPTLGSLLYFLLLSFQFGTFVKASIIFLIFISTYLIPLGILFLFKKFQIIQSFDVSTIKERKILLCLMIVLYFFLGETFDRIPNIRALAVLFYATACGLIFLYLLFIFKLKTSLHLLSMGLATGFFLFLQTQYAQSFLLIIVVFVILSGFVGTSRLYLKAHTPQEVYIGFLLGLCSPLITAAVLFS